VPDLFEEAVWVGIGADKLRAGGFEWPARMATAYKSFEKASISGAQMPIIFSDAATETARLIGWAGLRSMELAEGRTTLRFGRMHALQGHRVSELTKLSDGKHISDGILKGQCPCSTPFFLGIEPDMEDEGEDPSLWGQTPEGRRRLVTHFTIERNRRLVERLKASWSKQDSLLRCEVCNFSFLERYRELYVEAHHRVPLSTLRGREVRTKPQDFAPVCANCHRVLHQIGCSIAELQRRVSSK
jgi:hypothetical protein